MSSSKTFAFSQQANLLLAFHLIEMEQLCFPWMYNKNSKLAIYIIHRRIRRRIAVTERDGVKNSVFLTLSLKKCGGSGTSYPRRGYGMELTTGIILAWAYSVSKLITTYQKDDPGSNVREVES